MGGIVGLRDVLVVAPAASFHQHPHHESYYSAAGTEHPILTASPCLMGDDPHDPRGKSSGIHLWHQQQQQHHHPHPPQNPNPNPNSYLKKPMMPMLDSTGILSYGSGTTTCQDCGNQAKKDCSHRRCRTCCKSRGYDCTTHVKSTWVPAARRRERQISAPGGAGAPPANSSLSTSAPKKPRLLSSQTTTTSHTSTSNNTTTRSYDTSSSHPDGRSRESLPGQVRAPAVFKCVRVSCMDDDGEDEYAYQAVVKIGGHVFKGFLYDQGADDGREEHSAIAAATTDATAAANNNTTTSAVPMNLSELHLGGAGTGASTGTAAMVTSDIYGGGGGLLGGGTAYGNPIN